MQAEPKQKAKIGSQMTRVIVCVPFKISVDYEVEVKNPADLEEVKRALEALDPSDWSHDPDFYECFGDEWRHCVQKVKRTDIFPAEPQS